MKLEGIGNGVRKLNPLLFSGARPNRLKVSGTSEKSLHAEIFDECRRRGWIALHGSMAERTHRTEGEPDFTILADRGRVFLVECKSAHGKLSPAQQAMAAHAVKLDHNIHVIRTRSEFIEIVDH